MPECYDKPIWTIDQLLRVMPRVPAQLRRVAPTVLGRRLSNAFRERIMLAVAVQNRCRYCQLAHTSFGQAAGLSPREVQAILGDEDLSSLAPRERLALAYVRDLTRREFASRDESMRQQMAAQFDEETLKVIEATAELMNLANRFGNTFDALLARLCSRDCSGAGWTDLALLAPMFLLGGAVVAPWVGLIWLIRGVRG